MNGMTLATTHTPVLQRYPFKILSLANASRSRRHPLVTLRNWTELAPTWQYSGAFHYAEAAGSFDVPVVVVPAAGVEGNVVAVHDVWAAVVIERVVQRQALTATVL